MEDFKTRLKGERKRLGLNQDKFAQLGGVTRDTQLNYENGSRKPDSDYLQRLSDAGIDVLFLFTGKLSVGSLSDDEEELLDGYRKLDLRAKARVLGVVEGASDADTPPSAPKNRSNITIHGGVGQQIHGETFKKVVGPRMVKAPSKKKS
ncbi:MULTISPECIES: helix-turn-helix domain-containing protein [Herbaspirillum]|uniref:Transcriptional regulator with XRE-family HTH domain n=1 Tax=Herbaspirillum frisingense TaxID=92645 RepID=A0ABU1PGR7_9BURK|nr:MULTISPECIES: helix-turn-helix transcriptional regulator [Herbaspirillum]MDR6584672.1 transcriptional regulator with XRE-family HTH domain [Herbaspirillum frisingense]